LRPKEFWAVNNVSFELKRGECLGLIGRNGAGKTTLLKMLNGLIKPDAGRIEMRGRVGALISLGAGFNGVLTGRENIYTNASVLGLTKKETDAKLDEIIDFAEIGDFLDTPVQNYSSGMAVRLGFAVASSLEPDILLIDEVLAVGDAGFHAKCYTALDKLRKKGVGMILVSHDMLAVQIAADRCIWLEHGRIREKGDTSKIISDYTIASNEQTLKSKVSVEPEHPCVHDAPIRIVDVQFVNQTKAGQDIFDTGDAMAIQVDYEAFAALPAVGCSIAVYGIQRAPVCGFNSLWDQHVISPIAAGRGKIVLHVEKLLLTRGAYRINVALWDREGKSSYDWHWGKWGFRVQSHGRVGGQYEQPHRWEHAHDV
jgi:lipopolysaccharide transport system ATP-binding protein